MASTGDFRVSRDFIRSIHIRLNLDSFFYFFPLVPFGLGWLIERYWSTIPGEIVLAVAGVIAIPSIIYILVSFSWFWLGSGRLNLLLTPLVLAAVIIGIFLLYTTILNSPNAFLNQQASIILLLAYLAVWATQIVLWAIHKRIHSQMIVE